MAISDSEDRLTRGRDRIRRPRRAQGVLLLGAGLEGFSIQLDRTAFQDQADLNMERSEGQAQVDWVDGSHGL